MHSSRISYHRRGVRNSAVWGSDKCRSGAWGLTVENQPRLHSAYVYWWRWRTAKIEAGIVSLSFGSHSDRATSVSPDPGEKSWQTCSHHGHGYLRIFNLSEVARCGYARWSSAANLELSRDSLRPHICIAAAAVAHRNLRHFERRGSKARATERRRARQCRSVGRLLSL